MSHTCGECLCATCDLCLACYGEDVCRLIEDGHYEEQIRHAVECGCDEDEEAET